jgi:hypothetical protein
MERKIHMDNEYSIDVHGDVEHHVEFHPHNGKNNSTFL